MSKSAAFYKTIPMLIDQVAATTATEKMAVVNGYSGSDRLHEAATERGWVGIAPALHVASSDDAIRQQLARLLVSSLFIQSERLSRFLRFIVEHAIAGNQKYLKEYVIGSEVYERKPPYDPSRDSIVRTEARRLRNKLKQYYETEGKDDSMYVYLRPGSYVPIFQAKAALASMPSPVEPYKPFLSAGSISVVAIFAFTDISGSMLSSKCASGISDELAFTLLRAHGCKVISPASTTHSRAPKQDIAAVMSKVGAQIAFEGSVREENNHIRVIARIVDEAGFQLWATRFDADAAALTMFAIEEQIAAALSAGYDSLFAAPLRQSTDDLGSRCGS